MQTMQAAFFVEHAGNDGILLQHISRMNMWVGRCAIHCQHVCGLGLASSRRRPCLHLPFGGTLVDQNA